jgi:hypothetical protein
MMRRYVVILLLSVVALAPAVAQTRIAADKSMKELGRSDSRFTNSDRKRNTDLRGLMRSDYTGNYHSLGMYAYGGWSALLSSSDIITSTPGGYSLRLGGLYEFRHKYFIIQVGAGIMYRDIQTTVNDYRYSNTEMAETWDERWSSVADTWGMPISLLTYDMSARQDKLQQLHVQVSLLGGVIWNGWYALAGLTPSMPLVQHASTTFNITSRGSYDRYLGLGDNGYWGEMDNHGYRKEVPLKRKMNGLPRRLDIMVSLEGGYDWNFKENTHLRVAAYARCGVMNMATDNGKSVYIPYSSKWDFETFEATPIWFSDVAEGNQLHNFSVGLKLTLLYTFPQPDKCILCSQNHGKQRRR